MLAAEIAKGGLDEGRSRLLEELLEPYPVDRVLALDAIPRDARHGSRTDRVALTSRLEAVLARGPEE